MIRQFLIVCFLLCVGVLHVPQALRAQDNPASFDIKSRQDIQRAINLLRADLSASPLAVSASKQHVMSDDSSSTGGITGRIEGITPGDSAWVLAIAAHLLEDPTAWALGEVQDDGAYSITGLKHGVYIILAGADGYMSQYFSRAYFVWEAIPVDVAPLEMTQGIDFFLEPILQGSGQISGQVTVEETGEPLSRAIISASLIGNPFISAIGYSNDDGTYTIDHVRPGEYRVTASAEWYLSETYDNISSLNNEEPTPVLVVDAEETTGIDFSLSRGGTISGKVVDEDGNPVVGAEIWVMPPNDMGEPYPDVDYQYSWTTTDENGDYLASGLVDGKYFVLAQAYAFNFRISRWYDNVNAFEEATLVDVRLGENTPDIDFTLDINVEIGSLSGRIENPDSDGILEAQVRLESMSRSDFYYHAYAHADPDGAYRFDNVPADTYRVALEYWTESYYNIIWYDGATSPEAATPVAVEGDRETTGIDFLVPEANGEITGIVTDESGNPIAGAYIQLGPPTYGQPYEEFYFWGYSTTDNDGVYRVSNIPDGEYSVSVFYCYFYECIQRWWKDAPYPEEAEIIIVADGMTDPPSVDFTLPIELGSNALSGTVINEDGQPLAGAQVSIMPFEYITPGGDSDVWSTQMHTFTDSAGDYRFNTLPTGTFLVHSSYWADGAYDEQWYQNAEEPQNATPISLDENQVVEDIDFTLAIRPLYGSVEGIVFLEDGSPLRRAYVKAHPLYEDIALDIAFWAEWYAITDDEGRFVLDGLPAGEYVLNTYAQGASEINVDPDGRNVDPVHVIGGEHTVVEVLMRRQESGAVELSGSVFGTQGDVPDIGVVLATPATDGPGESFYTAITDETGFYTFDGLPEGAYFIQAMAPWHVSKYYDNTTAPEEASLVEIVTNQPVAGIDFSLDNLYYILAEPAEVEFRGTNHTSSVWGSVTDDRGEPVAMATVYVMNSQGEALLSAQTLRDGSYQIAGIPPGEAYHLKATHVGYTSTFNGASGDIEQAPPVTMNSGAYQHNFTLYPVLSTDIDKTPSLPDHVTVQGNFPNPFNGRTSISLSIPRATHIQLTIYDALGREVHSLVDDVLSAGSHTIQWDVQASTPSLPSGIYFYRVSDGHMVKSGSMTFFK